MLPLERQRAIVELVKEKRNISVEELCQTLYSSGATIRRDLRELAQTGEIRRTHGGACYVEPDTADLPLYVRETENLDKKIDIAEKAVSYIAEGSTIFLDSSSTCAMLAKKLNKFKKLTVVTNSVNIVQILADMPNIDVYCSGGKLEHGKQTLTGSQALSFISNFYAHTAFISCKGINNTIVTDSSEVQAEIKRLMISHAEKSCLLVDKTKFGKTASFKICEKNNVTIITDDGYTESLQSGEFIPEDDANTAPQNAINFFPVSAPNEESPQKTQTAPDNTDDEPTFINALSEFPIGGEF